MKAVTIRFVLSGVSASMAAGHGELSSQHVLDLTNPNVVITAPVVNGGSGIGFEGQPPPARLPLMLRLLRLDRDRYRVGEPITYDVEMTNMGNQPIGLPWSADRELIEQPGRSFIYSTLVLLVTDSDGNDQRIGRVILDGSTSVRGSIERLLPGEVAVIRAASAVRVSDGATIAGEWPLLTRASYTLTTARFTEWQELRSVNRLQILFVPPSR